MRDGHAVQGRGAWAVQLVVAALVGGFLSAGCGAVPGSEGIATDVPVDVAAGAGGASPGAAGVSPGVGGRIGMAPEYLGRERCAPPPGVSGSPRTIEEAVQLLNALPKPTSVACFVESLDRPLAAHATSSDFSAQPAFSETSPRVFLRIDRLWVSVVMDGESSYLIEFSFLQEDNVMTIKGELEAPFQEALAPSAPYDRVKYNGGGTVCGLCHFDEVKVDSIEFAEVFASTAFRPRPESHVSLEALRAEANACNWDVEPHRCEMLSALFAGGAVEEVEFPSHLPTFF